MDKAESSLWRRLRPILQTAEGIVILSLALSRQTSIALFCDESGVDRS